MNGGWIVDGVAVVAWIHYSPRFCSVTRFVRPVLLEDRMPGNEFRNGGVKKRPTHKSTESRMRHTRREILATTLTVLATSGLSCGGDDGPTPPTGPDCLANGAEVLTGNAFHTMRVSAADVRAGVEKTYNIQGTSNHAHSVTLTAEHFAQLRANQSVTVNSTSGAFASGFSHDHGVTVQCV